MTSLNLEDLLKNSLTTQDADIIKTLKSWGVEDPNSKDSYRAYTNLFPQKVSYYDGQLVHREDNRKIAFSYNIKEDLSPIENIRLFNRAVNIYDKLKELGLLYKSFSELYPQGPKAVIYSFRLADTPDYSRQIIIDLDKYTICDGATNKFVTLVEPSKLSERLEVLNLVVHLVNHPDDQETQQKLERLEQGHSAEPVNALDALRQEQQELDEQMAKLRARRTTIAQSISDLEELECKNKTETDNKRITAFLNKYPKITYNGFSFYTDLKPSVYLNYKYPNGSLTLDKAFADIERYLQLLPVLQTDRALSGNIANSLERLNHDVAYDIRLNPDNTVTIHAQDFDTWYNHQVEQDGITISYGYPDDTEPLTILFDLEETYDNSNGFIELPQALRDMSDRIAKRKKLTKGETGDD